MYQTIHHVPKGAEIELRNMRRSLRKRHTAHFDTAMLDEINLPKTKESDSWATEPGALNPRWNRLFNRRKMKVTFSQHIPEEQTAQLEEQQNLV